MEKQTIITTIIISLITITIIILIGILSVNKTSSQVLEFCAEKDWEGLHTITGDLSGEINCKGIWELRFADGKWSEECSVFPITTKPSCKWLCVQDCKLFNKQSGEIRCVC